MTQFLELVEKARKILIGQPNLKFEELPAIFSGYQSFKIVHNPTKKIPGARSLQAHNKRVSIIYHTTKGSRGLVETVDIAYPGKFGMILTLVNDEVTTFERIGGIDIRNPMLSVEERVALAAFMKGVRGCFDQIRDDEDKRELIDGKPVS